MKSQALLPVLTCVYYAIDMDRNVIDALGVGPRIGSPADMMTMMIMYNRSILPHQILNQVAGDEFGADMLNLRMVLCITGSTN